MSDEEYEWLAVWAAKHRCMLESDGVCGFGRPCVGIVQGSGYVDLPDCPMGMGEPTDEERAQYEAWAEAQAPTGVEAYHKHACLAVLHDGSDAGRRDAMGQLYRWVKQLDDRGYTVSTEDRVNDSTIAAFLHGPTRAFLTREAAGVPERAKGTQ